MNHNRSLKIREIITALRGNESFLIATHVRPDGDAIGALLGIKLILERLGKKADVFSQDKFPPEYDFLPHAARVRCRPAEPSGYDAAILVDCGDFERVGEELAEFISSRVPLVINIDHHLSGIPFGGVHWVEPGASSTCEMLFDICMHLSLPFDTDLATLLYTGLLTDTGSFRFSNTNRRVLEVAAMLVESGADPVMIAQQVYDSASPERLNLLALVLATVKFHADSRIATAELSRGMLTATSTSYMDSEGFINHLRSVKSVFMAILFREGSDGVIHVSLRSRNGIDVARFAQRYGGGGHLLAAACRIPGPLETVRTLLTRDAVDYIA